MESETTRASESWLHQECHWTTTGWDQSALWLALWLPPCERESFRKWEGTPTRGGRLKGILRFSNSLCWGVERSKSTYVTPCSKSGALLRNQNVSWRRLGQSRHLSALVLRKLGKGKADRSVADILACLDLLSACDDRLAEVGAAFEQASRRSQLAGGTPSVGVCNYRLGRMYVQTCAALVSTCLKGSHKRRQTNRRDSTLMSQCCMASPSSYNGATRQL